MRKTAKVKAAEKPKITTHTFDLGRHSFSLNEPLDATRLTLLQLAIDVSASATEHLRQYESLIKRVVKACSQSEWKNNLLLRVVAFDASIEEVHGFQSLSSCESFHYDDALTPGGVIDLNDAALHGVEAAVRCGKYLVGNDYLCNGLLLVITDGLGNRSRSDPNQVKTAIEQATRGQSLASFTSVLVGLCDKRGQGDDGVSKDLMKFVDQTGFTRYIEMEDVTDSAFHQLADAISTLTFSVARSLVTAEPPKDDNPPNKFRLGDGLAYLPTNGIESAFPNLAKWVRGGWIEVGDQDGRGFAARALDAGGLIYEKEGCQTLAEAMDALETGLEKWFQENG